MAEVQMTADFQNMDMRWLRFKQDGNDFPLHLVLQMLTADYGSTEAIHQASEFCLHTSSEQNQRIGLEFLYAYGYLEKMEVLIERNLQSPSEWNRQWGMLYRIIHEWKMTNTSPSEYLHKLEPLGTEDQAINCLKNFIYVYAHFEREQYGKLGCYLDKIRDGIHQLNDPLIRELFSIRLDELLLTYHWKRNEMLIARKHGYRILNRTYNERKKAGVHNALALGFIFDSYKQAMYHATEARKLAEKHNDSDLIKEVEHHTIPFIAGYCGHTEGVDSVFVSEKAYLALARGQKEKCIQLLSQLDELTPFQLYCLGRAKESSSLLEESHSRFINEQSDYFFAKLPLRELHDMDRNH